MILLLYSPSCKKKLFDEKNNIANLVWGLSSKIQWHVKAQKWKELYSHLEIILIAHKKPTALF